MISRVRFSNCMFFLYLHVCTGRTALCQRRTHSFRNQTSSSFDKVVIIITEYILYHLFFIFITFQLYRYRCVPSCDVLYRREQCVRLQCVIWPPLYIPSHPNRASDQSHPPTEVRLNSAEFDFA